MLFILTIFPSSVHPLHLHLRWRDVLPPASRPLREQDCGGEALQGGGGRGGAIREDKDRAKHRHGLLQRAEGRAEEGREPGRYGEGKSRTKKTCLRKYRADF